VQVFLLDLYQGFGGPLTCSIAYKSANNILSGLHHWSDPRPDKFSNLIKSDTIKTKFADPIPTNNAQNFFNAHSSTIGNSATILKQTLRNLMDV
jgi:hypothetical protein